MAQAAVFKVGDLKVRGGAFTFSPSPKTEFIVPKGNEAQVGVHYDYNEGSVGKERTHVVFSIQVGAAAQERTEVTIGDTPLVPDARMGFLSKIHRLPPGEHRGRYVVEAAYGASSWFGRIMRRSKTFRHEGDFVLQVR